MVNLHTRIDYKVYIAGVLVPAVSVSVTTQVGALGTAQITMPAHPMLLNVGKNDRLQVAIFYLDSDPTTGELNWNLLYEGYLAGMSYSASALSREMSLFVMSNLSVLDSLYLEFLGGKGGGKLGKPNKSAPNQITMRGRYPRRLFTQGLKNKKYITRPYDFIGNIFLAVAGRFSDRDISKKSSTKGVTAFIEKLSLATKTKRDTDLKALLSLPQDRRLKAYKDKVRNVLALIQSAADRAALPSIDSADTIEKVRALLDEVDSVYIKQSTEDFLGKRNPESRKVANTGFFARYFNVTKMEQHFVASPIIEGSVDSDVTKMPSGIFPLLRTSRGKKYVRAITRQTGAKFGQAGSVGSLMKNIFNMMNYQVLDIACPPAYAVDKNGLPKGEFNSRLTNNRIAQYISAPICNFGLPPMFNAIFPCMVRNWSVSNQYGSAPTRVYYNRKSQGNKLNTKSSKKGYADSGSFVGYPAKITRHAQDASNSSASDLDVLVFPEEYYRGPNPLFTEINPLLYQIKTLENSRRLNSAIPTSKEDAQILGTESLPADQVNMLEEAILKAKAKGDHSYALYVKQAQVDYVTARTGNSTITANLVFNPNLVAGFGTMMFDSQDSNCHMIGSLLSVSHTLSQGQAFTSVNIGTARKVQDMLVGILNQGAQNIMHPLEPLTEVREVLQVPEVSNLYYGELFYQGSILGSQINQNGDSFKKILAKRKEVLKKTQEVTELEDGKDTAPEDLTLAKSELNSLTQELSELLTSEGPNQAASTQGGDSPALQEGNFVLNWPKFFQVVDNKKQPASLGGLRQPDLSDFIGRTRFVMTQEEKRDTYLTLLRGFLVQNPDLDKVFNNVALAMKLVRRPICNLEQYIDFYKMAPDFINPASTITGGRGRGTRAKKAFLDGSQVAPYYHIIREFVSGPGVEPGAKVSGEIEVTEGDATPQVSLELKYRTGDSEHNMVERVFTRLVVGDTASVQDLPDLAANTQEQLLFYSDIIKSGGAL